MRKKERKEKGFELVNLANDEWWMMNDDGKENQGNFSYLIVRDGRRVLTPDEENPVDTYNTNYEFVEGTTI